MAGKLNLHVFVLCWPGWEVAAHHIAKMVDGHADHLTVLYKNDTGQIETGPGDWRKIPSDWYYGWQFRETLALNQGGIMLHIQADASFGDWPRLIQRCRYAYDTVPGLGIWSPNVYHSWYTPELAQVMVLPGEDLVGVALADGVVWTLSSALVEQMSRLDYSNCNLGWGCNLGAAAVAVTHGSCVAMDLGLNVVHPQGSGYDREKAGHELIEFISQLSPAQQSYSLTAYRLMKLREEMAYMRAAKPIRFLKPSYWRDKWRRMSMPEPGDLRA